MTDFTKKELERIREVKNMAEYYNALNKKNKAAWARMFHVPRVEPVETVAGYIARTGCKTEERISKKGTPLVKVYYENGETREYEKGRLNTTSAYKTLEELMMDSDKRVYRGCGYCRLLRAEG